SRNRDPVLVRQASAGSDADDAGGVLRTAIQRSVARFPSWSRLSHCVERGLLPLEGNHVVSRRGHSRLLRSHRPYGVAVDSPREDPRSPFPAAAREPARGWIFGGVALSFNPKWSTARGSPQPHS